MTPEIHDKVRIIQIISKQIAEILWLDKRTQSQSIMLQQLRDRRASLLGTLPKLKIIAGTDMPGQEITL